MKDHMRAIVIEKPAGPQISPYAYNVYYVKFYYLLLSVAQQTPSPAGYQASATRFDVGRVLLVVFVFIARCRRVIQNAGGYQVA